MLLSMTGFGSYLRSQRKNPYVEIKSLNGKQLDFDLSVPFGVLLKWMYATRFSAVIQRWNRSTSTTGQDAYNKPRCFFGLPEPIE